jgi:hypothetical protein
MKALKIVLFVTCAILGAALVAQIVGSGRVGF